MGDYAVTFRVAGLLEDTKRLLTFRSRLRLAMLDCLHQGGIEIVSPNFMNVRDFDSRHDFVPDSAVSTTSTADDAPLDVVFDKAEEAETLSSLQKQQTDLTAELGTLGSRIKEAPDKEAKQKLESELARTEQQLARLQTEIEASETREKDRDD